LELLFKIFKRIYISMTTDWIPKFKVGDYLQWENEKFYIINIHNNGYYIISFQKNGPSSKYLYRFGKTVDDGYRNFGAAIKMI